MNTKFKTKERRASSRFTIRDDVILMTFGMSTKEICVLEDISKSGAKFYATQALAVGNRVELRIPAPEDEPEVIIQAKILRVEAGDHGKLYGYGCLIESAENA